MKDVPLVTFMALGRTLTGMSMSDTGKPRSGLSSPDVPHQGWVERKYQLPRPAGNALNNAAHNNVGCLGFKDTCSPWCPPGPMGPSLQSSFPASQPTACTDARSCSSLGAGLATSLCWTSWHSRLLISPACWGSSKRQPNPLVFQLLLLPVLYHQQICAEWAWAHHPGD